jgi:hypothetical protein
MRITDAITKLCNGKVGKVIVVDRFVEGEHELLADLVVFRNV